ncbi:phosphatidylglycerol:prolipoprotein diacylglycerol transferase [Entomoplasma freundtii]|uniref:Prolipoprotein diacylglyceryl transferase n=1 Tax=Entomoplasma freundtii TaxID=74700 RepID=A0A2K8NSX3_9MOLU|nr:prolipoprotein diacylglyceryl transferase family protein [Entomoplasma freundtii]ATZ16656.1 prolipoprotein diacylglyceryl transferase [Entomoplasma freundtii]TDY58177.1 phosphatidylglycerol:prolipoprotein diacylglycerol transferase [Entomoplasma freundtii]
MINWKEGDNWTFTGTPGIHGDYGGFHVYAFTMTLGMILAILYSFYKFRKRDLSFDSLIWGVLFIVPVSLFGASVFGKLNANGPGENAGGVGFWGLFAFWEAGMSIHGGVYAGLIMGLVVFGIIGRKTKVSLWTYMDAIIPNILLGQVVGRWGNFFNHELVGAPIRLLGHTNSFGKNQWGFIDFNSLGIPDPWANSPLGWIWKNTSAVYDGPETWINGIHLEPGAVCQMLPIFLIESLALLAVWLLVTFLIPNIGKWFGPKPWKVEPTKYQKSWRTSSIWAKAFINDVDSLAVNNYQVYKNNNYEDDGRWERGRHLINANNPHGYWITKAGCEASAYFFGWNLVRFVLELSRPDDHLFIMYDKPLSLALIGVSAFIGLIGMVLTQIVIPQLTRREGWVYEKPYFVTNMNEGGHESDQLKATKVIQPKSNKAQKALEKMQKRELNK